MEEEESIFSLFVGKLCPLSLISWEITMKKEEKRKRQRGRNGCTETDANLSYVIYRSKVGCTVHRTYFRDSRVEARWPIFVFTGLSARTRAFLRSRETMLGLPRLRDPKITKKKKKKMKLAASSRRFDTDSIDLTTNETRRFHEIELPFSHPCD